MPADFSQVNHLAADLAKAGVRQVAVAQRVVQKTALDIVASAKGLAAVDTGAMRDSIGADIGVLSAVVGPTTNYAPYVEYGTSRQAPQPFMEPAATRHTPAYVRAMEKVAEGLL